MKTLLSKSKIILTVLTLTPLFMSSMGGQWLLKVQIIVARTPTIAYLSADHGARYYDQKMHDDAALFMKEFLQRNGKEPHVTFYLNVIDHREIANAAPFPMYPWEYDHTSAIQIDPLQVSYIKLDDVWVRDDYHVVVMNALTANDTLWLGNDYIEAYPVGDEVGCRLLVCDFGQSVKGQNLVHELVEHYDLERGWREEQLIQLKTLVDELTKERIVVIELCGC